MKLAPTKDLFPIFLFYVVGDMVTTYLCLKYELGQEYNIFVAPILNNDLGFIWLSIIKIVYIILLGGAGYYLINNNYLKTWKILKYYVLLLGISVTVSNSLVIFTGSNLFQHMGLM